MARTVFVKSNDNVGVSVNSPPAVRGQKGVASYTNPAPEHSTRRRSRDRRPPFRRPRRLYARHRQKLSRSSRSNESCSSGALTGESLSWDVGRQATAFVAAVQREPRCAGGSPFEPNEEMRKRAESEPLPKECHGRTTAPARGSDRLPAGCATALMAGRTRSSNGSTRAGAAPPSSIASEPRRRSSPWCGTSATEDGPVHSRVLAPVIALEPEAAAVEGPRSGPASVRSHTTLPRQRLVK